MINKQIYFPGLNGVRFFAAFFVLLDHLELNKGYFGYKTFWDESFCSHLGSFGVTIFFVLSGYLITYLLLTEKAVTTISIKNFYIRRVLRIWPLYFLIIIISFFIVPHIPFLKVPGYGVDISQQFGAKLALFSFLLANIAFVYLPMVAFGNVLWSVAVEEQFYLVWPHIVKIFKNTFYALVTLLIVYVAIKISFKLNFFNIKSVLNLSNRIDGLIDRTRFSCMIIGGLGALVSYNKKPALLKLLFSKYTQFAFLIFFSILFSNSVQIPFFFLIKNEVIAFTVIVLLINISTNPRSVLNLENKLFDFLGKVSYGIYVYHLFAVVICIKLFSLFPPATTMQYFMWNAGLLLSVLLTTIFIANLSYKYFEIKILKQKMKYSTVVSGDMVEKK